MDMSDIASRLFTKFGGGSRPDLRRALYEELEEMVYNGGTNAERIYQVIASVAADAIGKDKPGNYFAHVVKMRLKECKLLQMAEL